MGVFQTVLILFSLFILAVVVGWCERDGCHGRRLMPRVEFPRKTGRVAKRRNSGMNESVLRS